MPILVPYRYTYFTGALIFMIPWIILYLHRRDVRREMLVMSVFSAVASIVTAYLWWTRDWWRPDTVTYTVVGIEDIILGFSNGGIAAVIYEEVFKKHLYRRKTREQPYQIIELVVGALLLMSVLFWIFHITSFLSSTIALIAVTFMLILIRHDLFINTVASGILMALVSVPVYLVLIALSPGWVEKTWLFRHLSGVMLLGIPAEDIIFYFLMGCVVGPMYEVWCGYRIKKE